MSSIQAIQIGGFQMMDEGNLLITEETVTFLRGVNDIANQGRGRYTFTQSVSLSMVERLAILQGTKKQLLLTCSSQE